MTQVEEPELLEKAHAVAATLGLPLEVRHTGYHLLEAQLRDWMERHAS
jgi:hypothetical protein